MFRNLVDLSDCREPVKPGFRAMIAFDFNFYEFGVVPSKAEETRMLEA